jgi:predicted signal transduction protein with EAL and GGDEF domain
MAERTAIESQPTPPAHLHLPPIEEELSARVLARTGALMAGAGGIVTGLAADRIRTVLDTPFRLQDSDLHLAASVGASVFPLDAQDAETLLKHADTALYQAKAAGRNTARMYSAPTMTIADQLSISSRLRQAFDRRQLQLVYQPIVDLRSGLAVGVEALLRWDSEQGPVSPAGSSRSPSAPA